LSRKRGKLSNQEMDYIRQNCFDLSIEEIANNINRTVEPVKKFIDQENLKARDLTDAEVLLSTLRSRYYYPNLQEQFNDGEMIMFEHQWIDYFKQFNEDVTHSEEMQIVEIVRTEILINRSMVDRRRIAVESERLQQLIDEEMEREDRNTDLIATWNAQLGTYIGSQGAYINEHDKLSTKKEKYLRELKGTRNQRKSIADDAKTNFSMWLRQLNEQEERNREGFDMEVNRLAMEKEKRRLAEYHEYEDGEVDQPLLNSETLIRETEDE
jgi:hypothetical protein